MQIQVASLHITLFILFALLFFYFSSIKLAYAHITKKYGNLSVEVGWSNEPALVGELNNAIVQVNQTNGKNTQTPVINALANMNILAKYGGVTKPLDFVPSAQQDGLYEAQMIPTRVGSYSLALNGTIREQKISAEIPLDLVESKQKFNFPDTASSSGGTDTTTTAATASAASNNIGPQLQGIVSQLSNDIDTTKGSIDALAKNGAGTQKSIQDLKSAADRSYMIAMGGVGAGIAGIVIAAVALSRKDPVKVT
jgi:hypothetical protein